MHYYNKHTKTHESGLVTFGTTEPLLTVLDVRGCPIQDMFLMGINDNCGRIIIPTVERATQVQTALEPAYQVRTRQLENGHWAADYDRRELDGAVPEWFLRDLVLTDGTVAMKDGRWMR